MQLGILFPSCTNYNNDLNELNSNISELNNIKNGAYVISTQSDIPANSWTNVLNLTVPASGIYLISWSVAFVSSTTSGLAGTRIRTSSTISSALQYMYNSPSGVQISFGECYISQLNKNEVVYIDAFTNNARNCSNRRLSLIPII